MRCYRLCSNVLGSNRERNLRLTEVETPALSNSNLLTSQRVIVTITNLLVCLVALVFLIAVGAWEAHRSIKRQESLLARLLERMEVIAKSIDVELAPPLSSQNIRSRLDAIAHDARLLRKLAYDEGDAVAAHRKELEDRAEESQFSYQHPAAILRN